MTRLLLAFMFRDAAIERTYRFNLLLRAAGIFFQLAVFYFLSTLVPDPGYFAFLLVGLMFSRFFQFWLDIFALNLRQEQYWGTGEQVFLSPHPPLRIVLAASGSKFLVLAAELAGYALFGILVFGAAFSVSFPAVLPLLALSTVAFGGLGLISGGFILYFKRGDPVNWFVANSFDLLSGVYFPLAVLPRFLQDAARFLPTTPALDAWRRALLEQTFPALPELGLLAFWALGLGALGLWSFTKAFDETRKKGDLGSY